MEHSPVHMSLSSRWQAPRASTNSQDLAALTDIELIKRLAAGDESALDVLYARHAAALTRYLRQLSRDPLEADEILQDTFVAAWTSAKRFEGRSTVRTWLFSIARRQWRDRHRRHALDLNADADLDQLTDPAPTPDEVALDAVASEELSALVERLSPAHREVLALAFVDELSYAEIAQVLEVPVGTVKSRLNHAKQALKKLLRLREESKP